MNRFPGLYVPALPKKLFVGNMSEETGLQRTHLLTRFLQQITLCPYLLESHDFGIFMSKVLHYET